MRIKISTFAYKYSSSLWLTLASAAIFFGITQLIGDSIKDQSIKKSAHTGGAESIKFRIRQRLSQDGTTPPNGLWRAIQQKHEMSSVGIQSLSKDSWEWMGPSNIGGRVRGLVVNPNDSSMIWAGAATGGIWKSIDGGVNWTAKTDFMASLSVTHMAAVELGGGSLALYASTGEGFPVTDGDSPTACIRGAGLFRSLDLGETWTLIPGSNGTANDSFRYINDFLVDPNDPNATLLATEDGIFRGGASSAFEQVSPTGASDLKRDLINSSRIYAGTLFGSMLTSTDNGSTWNFASTPQHFVEFSKRVELAISKNGSQTVIYAQVAVFRPDGSQRGYIFRSLNGGQTFVPVLSDQPYLTQGSYASVIWADPENWETVVFGGLDLYRSLNGLSSPPDKISEWSEGDYGDRSAHADHHVIVPHPSYGTANNTLFFAHDGGVDKANDIMTVSQLSGWTQLRNSLGISQCYSASVNAQNNLIAGMQDNGNNVKLDVTEPASAWTKGTGGDGMMSLLHPTEPSVAFFEIQFGKMYRRELNGGTEEVISQNCPEAESPEAQFVCPTSFDATTTPRLFLGIKSVWRSSNPLSNSPSWNSIKAPIPHASVAAIGTHPTNNKRLWIGYTNGDIYHSKNADLNSPTFTKVDTNNLPNRWVSSFEVINDKTAYVSYFGWEYDNVWVTYNAGLSWVSLHKQGTFPQVPVSSVAVLDKHIFVGTDLGVFASEDGGKTWQAENGGPNNVAVDQLTWADRKNKSLLYAATFGRGVYRTGVAPDTDLVSADNDGMATGASLRHSYPANKSERFMDSNCDIAAVKHLTGIRDRRFRTSFPFGVGPNQPYWSATSRDGMQTIWNLTPDTQIIHRNNVTKSLESFAQLPNINGFVRYSVAAVPERDELYYTFYALDNSSARLVRYNYRTQNQLMIQSVTLTDGDYPFTGFDQFSSIHVSGNGRYVTWGNIEYSGTSNQSGQFGDPTITFETHIDKLATVFVFDNDSSQLTSVRTGSQTIDDLNVQSDFNGEDYMSVYNRQTTTDAGFPESALADNVGVVSCFTSFVTQTSISTLSGFNSLSISGHHLYMKGNTQITRIPSSGATVMRFHTMSDDGRFTLFFTDYYPYGADMSLRRIDSTRTRQPKEPEEIQLPGLYSANEPFFAAITPNGNSVVYETDVPLDTVHDQNGIIDLYIRRLPEPKR